MDIDEAAVFLAGSILTALGFIIWIGTILVVNNLVAKYWKSWGWTFMNWVNQQEPIRFMTQEEVENDARRSNQGQGKS